jgi:deoxyribonuclease (pyrimidine dimer)
MLADQHLRAEWVEFLMLPAFMKRSLKSKAGFSTTDSIKYTLNTGHAKFFYNKLNYVLKRYKEIELEMLKRGYQANPTLDLSIFDKNLFNDWTPNEQDMLVNIERIKLRISKKPDWYTYYRKPCNWNIFYTNKKERF